jgi:NAD-dependent DNA ligase
MPRTPSETARSGEVSPNVTPHSTAPRHEDQEPMLYCPVCSVRLAQRKCKLFCEKCGYYMSCADYY